MRHEINRGGRSAQCPSPPRTWFNSTRPVPIPIPPLIAGCRRLSAGRRRLFYSEVEMKHDMKREYSGKAEMYCITPTCSCGWKGNAEYAYNDYQLAMVKQQEADHILSCVSTVK